VSRLCSEIVDVPVICYSRSRLLFSYWYAEHSREGNFDFSQPMA
jgi:hypothetical protein